MKRIALNQTILNGLLKYHVEDVLYPERLANISALGKEVYEGIGKNAVIMNPSLRPTVEVKHSAALQQQDREQRIDEYQRKKSKAVSWLWGALVLHRRP